MTVCKSGKYKKIKILLKTTRKILKFYPEVKKNYEILEWGICSNCKVRRVCLKANLGSFVLTARWIDCVRLRSFALLSPTPPFRYHRLVVALTSCGERRGNVRSRMQVNYNLDVHDEIQRMWAGRREKEGKREREKKREMEQKRGRRRDQYGESVKSYASALRPPVRELARRRCIRRFDIDTVDNALLFLSFLSFFFQFLFFYHFLLKSRRKGNLTPARRKSK